MNSSSWQKADPIQKKLMEEMCILVDEKDNITGADTKRNCHWKDGKLHRAFSVFLFNDKNELLLQKRAQEKITFPLHWANTCCSHPLHTNSELESSDYLGVKRAASRKLEQELGMCVSEDAFTFLTKVIYKAASDEEWTEHEVDYILLLRGEYAFKANPNEVLETTFVGKNELKAFIENDANVLSPWFRMISKSLLPGWWNDLDGLPTDEKDTNIHPLTA